MDQNNNIITEIFNLSAQETPKFVENKYKDWVLYGEDNCFPDKLNSLSNNSALHNAIISSKVDSVKGKGLTYDGANNKKTDIWIENANEKESLNDIYFKCAYDLVIYGVSI